MNQKQKNTLIRILAAALCSAVLLLTDRYLSFWPLKLGLYLIPYFTVGWDIWKKALHGIRNKQVFDENFLMTVATLGAFAVGICDAVSGGDADYLEAVAVMLLYQVGELFQSLAIGRSRRSITALMDIRPDFANLLTDGEPERVDPYDVEIGSRILVRPGEKVPLDGIVREGISSVNTAALTGESRPRTVRPGDTVLSGTINESGVLELETTADFDESTASKILDLVENAASRKSSSENFISRFAHWYTPLVVCAALVLALLPPLVLWITGREPQFLSWLYRACIFLVISCPCAIVISVPLSFFGGLGGASSRGILIKGSNYLETLSKVRTVVFDKTGTVTKGSFEVDAVHHCPIPEDELLEITAHLEGASTHPIALSLRRAYAREPELSRVSEVQEISGRGLTGRVDGRRVAAGNEKLMTDLGLAFIPCRSSGIIIHVAVDGAYAGHIVIADEIKPDSAAALRALKQNGVTKTVMLTGDSEKVARAVAEAIGVDEVHAGLLPGDKVAELEKLLAEKPAGSALAFVGDGINDAPVLARADLGIAMGALGSDAAIEAADVVLMDDDPRKIAQAITLARRTLRIVKENIGFALGVKLICLILGALGIADMWLAIFADVGVMVLAILNALRTLGVKKEP